MNREEIPENEQSYLGIMGRDITKNYNQIYGMPIGVYITNTTKGSPAEKAGLKMGNIITGFNGTTIKTMPELQSKLASVKAGTTVKLTIMQYENGQYVEKEVQVTLGNRSELKNSASKSENSSEYGNNNNNNGNNENSEGGNNYFESPYGGSDDNSGNAEENPFNFFFNH